jgi:lactate permease
LTASVVLWGLKPVVTALDVVSWKHPVPGLHRLVYRMPPVTPAPKAEDALFDVSWLSTPGTGVVLAGFLVAPFVGLSIRKAWRVFCQCLWKLRLSMVAIMAMLGVGYLTRYCGMDATMGMAMSHTGKLFPFFGTMIGWLGVALSGTDAGSNALFGSFQVVTANRLGLSPILMGAANSAGGVMGKMIDAQSIVVASVATGGRPDSPDAGTVLRAVFWHSLALAALMGLLVMLQAYLFPWMIPR